MKEIIKLYDLYPDNTSIKKIQQIDCNVCLLGEAIGVPRVPIIGVRIISRSTVSAMVKEFGRDLKYSLNNRRYLSFHGGFTVFEILKR